MEASRPLVEQSRSLHAIWISGMCSPWSYWFGGEAWFSVTRADFTSLMALLPRGTRESVGAQVFIYGVHGDGTISSALT
jgi:hypothetical protein